MRTWTEEKVLRRMAWRVMMPNQVLRQGVGKVRDLEWLEWSGGVVGVMA